MAMILPSGFSAGATACGIKVDGSPDLGVIVADRNVRWAGAFTRNAAASPSVHWCRGLLGGEVRAVICNSGNANACTGTAGVRAVETVASEVAAILGCHQEEILVASTGTIGIELPVGLITSALPSLLASVEGSVEAFGKAIMTTDTKMKVASAEIDGALIVGVAKGAAMLAPNMATMLAFIVTDADVAGLQATLTEAVNTSFDRISVDACESTNDSVFLLAGGTVPVSTGGFARAVGSVCKDLAEQMVRDAEGGSRFVRIQVSGAADDEAAADLGRAVAASALWRAAVNGGDPNWGRVLAALGAADRSLDVSALCVAIGPETLFDKGEPTGSLEAARKAMEADDITLMCVVGEGSGSAEILSSDLSTEYVSLNAEGAT
jgi:glutamate N-acetyltransferase/amino-acid N-acetyltransferase